MAVSIMARAAALKKKTRVERNKDALLTLTKKAQNPGKPIIYNSVIKIKFHFAFCFHDLFIFQSFEVQAAKARLVAAASRIRPSPYKLAR